MFSNVHGEYLVFNIVYVCPYCRTPAVPHKKIIISAEDSREILRSHLRENLPPPPRDDIEQRITIRRSAIHTDALRQFGRKSLNLSMPFQVRFCGEPAIDTGGPKREFFRLFLQNLSHKQGNKFFSSPEGLVPILQYDAVSNLHFEIIGKIIGASIFLGGTAPHCFVPPVVDYLIYDQVNHIPTIRQIPDYEIRSKLETVSNFCL